METIDSFKLLLNPDCIRDIQQIRFDRQTFNPGANPDGKMFSITPAPIKDILVLNNLETGLKRIEYDMQKDSLIIEGSAKILHDQYMEGITANTIERVFDQINHTGVIDLNPAKSIETGILLRGDITRNIEVDYPVSEYTGALGLMPVNDKYIIDRYKGATVFRGKQKTFKERMIVYDKATEVKRDKEMRGYIKNIGNIARVETNLAQQKRIRYYFDTNILQGILMHPVKPNYLLFEKITHRAPNEVLELFDRYKDTKGLAELLKNEGMRNIIRILNFDIELIKQFISKQVKGNIRSRYLPEWIAVINQMYQEAGLKNLNTGYYTKLINELRTKLAA